MCGRYAADVEPDALVEMFEVAEVTEAGERACQPRYNIAPTTLVPVVFERPDGGRVLDAARWGLIPSWSKKPGRGLINARAETVATKSSFRAAIARRRCLLPALGYYEWRTDSAGAKRPHFVHRADQRLMALAGLFEHWRRPDGEWATSCAIITTAAADSLAWLHERMPGQIEGGDEAAWLDPAANDPTAALALLSDGRALAAGPVSTRVNRVGEDDPGLLDEEVGE